MTKNILVQYADLREEIKDIRKRIEKTQERLQKIQQGGTVMDSVTGTRADGTFGHIRIEGFPYADYDRQRARLFLYLAQLTKAETERLELTNEVEAYINAITDSRMRRIIQYRVIDDMSWGEVAANIGGNNSEDSVRMAFHRFLEK